MNYLHWILCFLHFVMGTCFGILWQRSSHNNLLVPNSKKDIITILRATLKNWGVTLLGRNRKRRCKTCGGEMMWIEPTPDCCVWRGWWCENCDDV